MSKIDPIRERQRLESMYASMTDEEINKLADAADELTEIARSALAAEIERRGGRLVLEEKSPTTEEEPSHPELVTVARFRDLPQATFARGLLESAAIDSFLADENAVRMDWFWSNAIGQMRLLVRETDAEAARQILEQPIPERFELGEGEPAFEQPKCPKCGSIDIQFEGVDPGVGLAAAWAVSIPVVLRQDRWTCNACGAKWQEIPEETSDDFRRA